MSFCCHLVPKLTNVIKVSPCQDTASLTYQRAIGTTGSNFWYKFALFYLQWKSELRTLNWDFKDEDWSSTILQENRMVKKSGPSVKYNNIQFKAFFSNHHMCFIHCFSPWLIQEPFTHKEKITCLLPCQKFVVCSERPWEFLAVVWTEKKMTNSHTITFP